MLVFALAFPHWFRLALGGDLVFESSWVYRIMLSCNILNLMLEMIICLWLPRFGSLILRRVRSLLILGARLGLCRTRSLNQWLLMVSWYLARRRWMLWLLYTLHLSVERRFGLCHTLLLFLTCRSRGSSRRRPRRVALMQSWLLKFAALFFVCLGCIAFCRLIMLPRCLLEEVVVALV